MDPSEIKALTLRLNGGQFPRVWSVLVTVFGELAQDKNARIEGTQISAILSLMGIKPEAIRVALHRLRKEGWITSVKAGRTSHYMLTDLGRRESAAANPQIYAPEPLAKDGWLILTNPSGKEEPPRGIGVFAHVFVSDQPPAAGDAFGVQIRATDRLPDWLAERLCSPDTAEQSRVLAEALGALKQSLTSGFSPDETTAQVLRVIVVHSWRRIALRVPSLPDTMFPKPWAGAACRAYLADVLAVLRRI